MLERCRALIAPVALGVLAIVAPAQAAVLDFPDSVTVCAGGCGNGSVILQTYGDATGIDVSYQTLNGEGNATQIQAFHRWWDANYSDLRGVAWGGTSNSTGVSEIRFNPAAGFEVELVSLELGAWPNTDRPTHVTVFSDDYSSTPFPRMPPTGTFTVDGDVHTDINLNLPFSADGYRIQWGPDSFDVGIDNIVFNVREIDGRVPEPTSLALIGAGLAGLAAYRRWRRG